MKKIKISLLVFIFAVFTSCDCLQHITGFTIDYETQLPIDKAMVKDTDTDRIIYTDSLGNFEYRAKVIGLFGCPNIKLSFEKEGYKKVTKRYKSCCTDNAVVVLKKQK